MLSLLRAPLRLLRPKPQEDPLSADFSRRQWARKQVLGADELTAIARACPDCGARAWELCLSPTGLAASAPCPGRLEARA